MWDKIKGYALYGDTDKQSYQAVKERIEVSNRITALVFAIVASILTGIMLLLSFFQEGFTGSKQVYIFGIMCSLIIIVVSVAAKKLPVLTYVAVYISLSVFLVYGIAIATITRPENQTVTFMVMLIFVPIIFVDRPLRMACTLVVYIILFIIMACQTKTGSVLSVDIADAIIFGILSIFSETVVYGTKIKSYVLENELRLISEMDQLTGLNNRNCYEWRIGTYSTLYNQSICCIYIDVNGLHELNNTKGHKAGDEMLQDIANVVKNQFGVKHTYRIGGDEYVAFVLDDSEESIKARIDEMNEQVREKGYHMAVGYEYCTSKNEDINRFIIKAESKMYKDKSDYYKVHDRRAR